MTVELLNVTTGVETPATGAGADTSVTATATETVVTPAVEVSPTPAVETPAVETPAAAETPKTEAAAEAAKPEPSLLAEAGKEEKPAAEEKPAEAPVEEPKVELPAYEAFKVPDGVEITDQGQLKAFTDLLGEYELQAKIPHELMQEMGQKLMDMYSGQLQKLQEVTTQRQISTWNETRAGWVDQIKNDPIIGRNRFDTVLKDVVAVRDKFAGEGFVDMLNYTGAGDHPGMIRFCANIAKYLEKHGLLREGQPVPAPAQTAAIPPNGKTGPRGRYSVKGA